MSKLMELRSAVIAGIKDALPDDWSVEGHLGRFAPSDLTKFITTAPAVRVAILGLADTVALDEDAIQTNAVVGVFVVAKDRGAKLAREVIAAAAVETIVIAAHGARWGLKGVMPALPATAQSIYNDDTLRQGVAFWGIDWRQPVVLSRAEAEADPLTALYVGLAPEIGAAHEADYFGPFPAQEGGADD